MRSIAALWVFSVLSACSGEREAASEPDPAEVLSDGGMARGRAPVTACGDSLQEVGAGGLFEGTTCGCADRVDLSTRCEGTTRERPEAQFRMTLPPGQWSCKVTVSEGLAYSISGEGVPTSCGSDTAPIDLSLPVEELPGIVFGGGDTGRVYQIAIETFDAPCGDYSMWVHCGDDLI